MYINEIRNTIRTDTMHGQARNPRKVQNQSAANQNHRRHRRKRKQRTTVTQKQRNSRIPDVTVPFELSTLKKTNKKSQKSDSTDPLQPATQKARAFGLLQSGIQRRIRLGVVRARGALLASSQRQRVFE